MRRRVRWWACRPGAALTVTFAVLTLILAALDCIEQAGETLLVMGVAAFIALVEALYRRLPSHDQDGVFSKRFMKWTALSSVVGGSAVAVFVWYVGWKVDLRLPTWALAVWGKLDFIPALFSLLLPEEWRSHFHHYFRSNITYCFPGPFWWESMVYLRTAIAAYAITFFVLACFGRLLARSVASKTRR